jgi:hypothetical protein
MTTAVLSSFAELAEVFAAKGDTKGDKIKSKAKAKKVSELETYLTIEDKCGRKAAGFLQDQEATKRSGKTGEILHDMETIVFVTGFKEETIFGSVVSLIRNGYAKSCGDGQRIRAA